MPARAGNRRKASAACWHVAAARDSGCLLPLTRCFLASKIDNSRSDYTVFVALPKTRLAALMMVVLPVALFFLTTGDHRRLHPFGGQRAPPHVGDVVEVRIERAQMLSLPREQIDRPLKRFAGAKAKAIAHTQPACVRLGP
jgi:hypothetical protein